jgi:hypothetical protein
LGLESWLNYFMPLNSHLLALLGGGVAATPPAFMLGKKWRDIKEQNPPKADAWADFLGRATAYLTNPEAVTGAGIGALTGGAIAQHLRQPLQGYGGKHIPVTKRPEELMGGTTTGAALGLILANMLRKGREEKMQLEEIL